MSAEQTAAAEAPSFPRTVPLLSPTNSGIVLKPQDLGLSLEVDPFDEEIIGGNVSTNNEDQLVPDEEFQLSPSYPADDESDSGSQVIELTDLEPDDSEPGGSVTGNEIG